MSQQIQIECPNCETINNVKKESPLSENEDIVFDCGKCGVEVTITIILGCNEQEEEYEEE